jgi:hypothetical protein
VAAGNPAGPPGGGGGASEQQPGGASGPLPARLRARLRARPDTEHEQALTRLVVVPAMLAYMLLAPFPPEQAAGIRQASLLIFAVGLASALLVALHILWRPGVSHARRSWSLLADVAGVAASMLASGTIASVFFPLLLVDHPRLRLPLRPHLPDPRSRGLGGRPSPPSWRSARIGGSRRSSTPR